MSKRSILDITDANIEILNCLTQVTRMKIFRALANTEDSMYIKEIATRIEATPRNTSFHLAEMAHKGILKATLGEVEGNNEDGFPSGRAAKFYSLSNRGLQIKEKLTIEI